MIDSMVLKVDGEACVVNYTDDSQDVVIVTLERGDVVQRGSELHPDLRRKLTQAVTEVVDGEVERGDVNIRHHM